MSLTEEQVAERHSGIGGSDAAAALGLSPWKSPLELFLDKREQRQVAPSQAMRWGTILEPVIRQEYAQLTGRVVRMPPGTIRHARHPFMLAHVDGVTDDGRVFEAKTARTDEGWGYSGTDQVPHHYFLQVQHYLAVTGLTVADIAVLIGGSDFRVFEIPADPELHSMLIAGEADFWKLVENNEPPPVNFEMDVSGLLRRMFPGTNGTTIQASATDQHYRSAYEHAANAAKVYERLAESAKAHMLMQMGEAARMVWPDDGVQLTRKVINRKAYSVEATQYVDARFSKIKETA